MNNYIIWQILIVLGIIYIIIKAISDVKNHQRIIKRNVQFIGRQKRKPRWTPISEANDETEEEEDYIMFEEEGI